MTKQLKTEIKKGVYLANFPDNEKKALSMVAAAKSLNLTEVILRALKEQKDFNEFLKIVNHLK